MFILEINTGNQLPKQVDVSRVRELQGKIARTDAYIDGVLDLMADEETIDEAKGYAKPTVNAARLAYARAEKLRYQGELKSLDVGVSIGDVTNTNVTEVGVNETTKSSNPITSFIEDFIKPGIEAVKEFVKPVTDFFKGMFGSAGETLKGAGKAIGKAVSSVVQAGKSAVKSVVDSARGLYDKGVKAVKNFFGGKPDDTKSSEKDKKSEDKW